MIKDDSKYVWMQMKFWKYFLALPIEKQKNIMKTISTLMRIIQSRNIHFCIILFAKISTKLLVICKFNLMLFCLEQLYNIN